MIGYKALAEMMFCLEREDVMSFLQAKETMLLVVVMERTPSVVTKAMILCSGMPK